ncbi:hypothetical protein GCM10009664_53500 [Kitasatospora gansuensis]
MRKDCGFKEFLITYRAGDQRSTAWEGPDGFQRVAVALVGIGQTLTREISENATGHWKIRPPCCRPEHGAWCGLAETVPL